MAERIVLAELRLLAELLGPGSVAGEAASVASTLPCPVVQRVGSRLFVWNADAEDTLVIRPWW